MVEVRPAATVVVVRENNGELQTLLLRRSAAVEFAGGSWVFPGGRLDPEDYAGSDDVERAARRAAVRETIEEAGLALDEAALVYFAHWTTPEEAPKRYATWFYLAPADEARQVTIDGSEIDDHIWATPADALVKQRAGVIQLMPPTFVTLLELAECRSVAEAKACFTRQPTIYLPRFVVVDGGMCSLYEGDAGYENKQADAPGPRHRFWMVANDWRYEKSADLC